MNRWVMLVAGFCAACAENANMCPLSPGGTETGSLSIRHLHEFGRNYEVFDVAYKMDDCVLLRATDTSVLRKQEVDLGTYDVPAGPHELRITTQFRSDFVAPGGDAYGWAWRDGTELLLEPGAKLQLTVRYFEDPSADPRYRMRTEFSVEDLALATGAEAAEN